MVIRFSNTYNPGWRNHPNFRWSNSSNNAATLNNGPPGFYTKPQAPMNNSSSSGGTSSNANYDKMFEVLTKSAQSMDKTTQMLLQTQQNQGNAIAELQKQMGDVVKTLSQIRDKGTLPGGTEENPAFHTVNAITTRVGTVLKPCRKECSSKNSGKSRRKVQNSGQLAGKF